VHVHTASVRIGSACSRSCMWRTAVAAQSLGVPTFPAPWCAPGSVRERGKVRGNQWHMSSRVHAPEHRWVTVIAGRPTITLPNPAFERTRISVVGMHVAFRDLRRGQVDDKPQALAPGAEATPEEALDAAYQRLRIDLESELLDQVKVASPAFFERLVVELLVRMGYGGTLRDAGQAVGKSGDGGIDGIIKEDLLGLDVIYIQAKKWEGTVGRPEIQKFAGALQGHRARKGVFITTSAFSSDAIEFAARIDSKIVLIDGATLARYMIDNDVGVSAYRSYQVKKIDSDYFSEE
jgi:restriction endonuclease Mrr